jgi:heme/copper-type cytochrome/quinol oxidase subunit 2
MTSSFIIICIFIVFTDNTVPVDESVLIVGAVAEAEETGGSNIWVMLLLIVVLIIVFAVIAFFAMKENKKHQSKAAETSMNISKSFDF